MRSLGVLALLLALKLLAGAALPAEEAARTTWAWERAGGGEARLVGRGRSDRQRAGAAGREAEERGPGEVLAAVVGPSGRPHTPAVRRRLFADRDAEGAEGDAGIERTLRHCEDHVVNELSLPCGLLLTGREDGEGPGVDEEAWIDLEDGTFESDLRTPYDVEALYVYGGRIHARAPLADEGTRLVVDPGLVFAHTGGIELSVRRGDTGETVADVVLEIEAVDREASTHADLVLDGGGALGVRPFLFPDLPAGVYHVRVERPGPPWTFGVATVQVRAGQVSRETITLGPGVSFRMRWFREDGRPTSSRYTTVALRDCDDRLHEVPVRDDDAESGLMTVSRAPPGRCWLVTADHRAHRLDLRTDVPAPELVVHLEDWSYVVLAVSCESLLPPGLAERAPSHWVVRDDQGVLVEEGRLALTPETREDDGTFQGWAHLTPGRYRVRWQLTPDRAVEESFVVPPGGGELWVVIDARDP